MGNHIVNEMNSLESWCRKNSRIDLLEEWDTEKNINLSPSEISYGSTQKAWWLCKKGHSWQAVISNRRSLLLNLRRD